LKVSLRRSIATELDFAAHRFADGRRRHVADVDLQPDLALARFQVRANQLVGGHFDEACHAGRRENLVIAARRRQVFRHFPHHFVAHADFERIHECPVSYHRINWPRCNTIRP
jgi:hypothetical protein